ncbi:MAG: hypothetical protein RLY78_1504 [Pseudomonadota bacterium]|jgi:type II secretory pathway pseudopilin PulG|uniref:Type II secretion system protein n=2 Tax=Pseudaquabacterium rugosum TaxID=2984194 RepID=A0ABU9BDG6_9BURK
MTLMELLLVVSILAALSGLGWTFYSGVRDAELTRLGQAQMRYVAQALRRFHTDMGYWPGQGPLALTAAHNIETVVTDHEITCSDPTGAGLWLRSTLPSIVVPAGVSDIETWRADWARHPANLWMLMARPLLCANHPLGRLQDWDATTARGWRGPYLRADQLGWLQAGNDLQPDGGGTGRNAPLQRDLQALGVGRWLPAVQADGSRCPEASDDCAWQWRVHASTAPGFDPSRHTFEASPRPLLYFGVASGRVRLVSMGPDGAFGGLHDADSARACEPYTADPAGLDDQVMCLD